jgi:hypothetical protein
MHTPQELYSKGRKLAEKFCSFNARLMPSCADHSDDVHKVNLCAYYRPHTGIIIYVTKCARPNQLYSWPSHISDRTPYGVVAHELGHHFDCELGNVASQVRSEAGEERLTSYCPNDAEWFAEMFRLFITNPALLAAVRPRTYAALVQGLALRPAVAGSWRTVLQRHAAPPRVLARAQAKVAATQRYEGYSVAAATERMLQL